MKILVGICLFVTLFNSAPAFAVNSLDLVEDAQFYDGAKIEYEGEVIGDIMVRGDFVWINVNDGNRAIGVWAKQDLAKKIKIKGDYGNVGDRIRVKGTFNRACTQHGGDLDIHAEKISIIEKGHKVEHPIDPKKVIVSVVLLLMVIAVILLPRIFKASS